MNNNVLLLLDNGGQKLTTTTQNDMDYTVREVHGTSAHFVTCKSGQVGDHCRATGHSLSMGNTKVLTQEQNWQKRKVKKAIYMKAPTMKRPGISPARHLQPNYPTKTWAISHGTRTWPRPTDDGLKRCTFQILCSKVSWFLTKQHWMTYIWTRQSSLPPESSYTNWTRSSWGTSNSSWTLKHTGPLDLNAAVWQVESILKGSSEMENNMTYLIVYFITSEHTLFIHI